MAASDASGARDGAAGSDAFVSYARADAAFVRRLSAALVERGKDVWVDLEDIPPTADWRARIHTGIEASRAFVSVLSPDLVASEICAEELAYATDSNKRVVPVLLREIERVGAPEALLAPNWIYFRDSDDFEHAVDTLVDALETDLDWLDAHARLLVRATEWERSGRDSSFYLRGRDLKGAEAWLAEQGAHREAPTLGQSEFVRASRRAAARRQRALLSGVVVALAVAVALGVVALLQRNDALRQSQISRSRELAARVAAELPSDPELGLLLAREALDVRETPQAEDALQRALRASHLRLTIGEGTGPVSSARFDPRGSRVAIAAHKTVEVRDARTGAVVVRLRGHDAAVTDARFSTDGRLVVTASADRTARIWDARTGQALAVLRGHRGPVTRAVFSRDGTRVLTASEDGRGGLWSVRSGKRIAFLSRDSASVTDAVFSRDGYRVATTGDGGQLRVWDGRTGALRRVVRANALSKPVYSPSLSPGGRLVAVASWDDARVWNTVTGRLVKFLPGHEVPGPEIWVHSTAFSEDGRFVVTAGVDGTARVWQVAGWRVVAVLQGHSGAVLTAVFSTDGTRILTTGLDRTARVWDSVTGDSIAVLRLPGHAITSAEFARDGNRVITATDDGVRVWDASGIVPAGRITPPPSKYLSSPWDAVFSPDGRLLATDNGAVDLWTVATRGHVARLRGRLGGFGPDSKRVVTLRGRAALIWNARTGGEVARVPLHSDATTVAFASGGTRLLTTGKDGTARVWDAGTGKAVWSLKVVDPDDTEAHTAFSPDGRLVASGGYDGVVVREAVTGTRHRLRASLAHVIGGLLLSPDGTLLYASGESADRYVAGIWDVTRGTRIASFAGLGGPERGSVFSPDGRLLLARDSETAFVRDATTGELLATMRGHGSSDVDALLSASFSPDSRLVLTSGADGTAKIWLATTGELVTTLRAGITDPAGGSWAWQAQFSTGGKRVAVVAGTSVLLYACTECAELAQLRTLADLRVKRTTTRTELARLTRALGP